MLTMLAHWLNIDKSDRSKKESPCICCGNCCKSFGGHLNATKQDQDRWQREGRKDLLNRVNRLGWIWVDPVTKELEDLCPFILEVDDKTSICAINHTKPVMCQDYPTLAHGRRCLRGFILN